MPSESMIKDESGIWNELEPRGKTVGLSDSYHWLNVSVKRIKRKIIANINFIFNIMNLQ
jgi:hypothetical protein